MAKKTVLILGAGPAGLTTAYELINQSDDYEIIVVDKNDKVGGLCRTPKYKNNYMDIGGHRYFTKFQKIKNWWLGILPLQTEPAKDDILLGRNSDLKMENLIINPQVSDEVMLKRYRFSRIFYLKKFFDYPVSLNYSTIMGLGLWRMTKIFFSYLKAKIFPIKPTETAQDFLINTFGYELYQTFFKNYTEKLWGIECDKISAEWGRERIRGIKIFEALVSFIKSLFTPKKVLSDDYLYPKTGAGLLWEKVAQIISSKGVTIRLNCEVCKINVNKNKVTEVEIINAGKTEKIKADYVVSSLAIKDLFSMMNDVPQNIQNIAGGLMYRNFRSAAVLLNKLKIKNKTEIKTLNNLLPDTWIYIQEDCVKMGRMQIYNNWSPYMLEDAEKVWIAFEYFASDTDDIWLMDNAEFEEFAVNEGIKIGIIDKADVLDITSEKLEKAYPAYFGTYNKFDELKKYCDTIKNLYLVGRNGMHKYINIDHAGLSGIEAAKNILNNLPDKENIWNINTDKFLD